MGSTENVYAITDEPYWCVHCRRKTPTTAGVCDECHQGKPVTVEDQEGRPLAQVGETGEPVIFGPRQDAGRGYPLFDFGEIAFLFDEITAFGEDGREVARFLIRTLRERVLEYVRDAEDADGERCWRTKEYGQWPGPTAEARLLADFYGYADEPAGADRERYVERRSARLRGVPDLEDAQAEDDLLRLGGGEGSDAR
jgi:hypothetical protein